MSILIINAPLNGLKAKAGLREKTDTGKAGQ
jgi:hypothetical protein